MVGGALEGQLQRGAGNHAAVRRPVAVRAAPQLRDDQRAAQRARDRQRLPDLRPRRGRPLSRWLCARPTCTAFSKKQSLPQSLLLCACHHTLSSSCARVANLNYASGG